MDLCSFDSRFLIANESEMFTMKPMQFYELRNQDKIFIGSHEIILINEPEKDKTVVIPETQDLFDSPPFTFDKPEDIEIPETQCFGSEDDIISCENDVKPAVDSELKTEFLIETQPLRNILPALTRARSIKQAEIKPKTVPIEIFDFDTQDLMADTQILDIDHYVKKEPAKTIKKRHFEPNKFDNKRKKNSILLSDDEDSDDERSRTSLKATVTYKRPRHQIDNSLNLTMTDDDSILIDSQFVALVNESQEDENMGSVSNTVIKTENVPKSEITKTETNQISDDDSPIKRRRAKIFRYLSSSDDEN